MVLALTLAFCAIRAACSALHALIGNFLTVSFGGI
jgi:hypothetical protein